MSLILFAECLSIIRNRVRIPWCRNILIWAFVLLYHRTALDRILNLEKSIRILFCSTVPDFMLNCLLLGFILYKPYKSYVSSQQRADHLYTCQHLSTSSCVFIPISSYIYILLFAESTIYNFYFILIAKFYGNIHISFFRSPRSDAVNATTFKLFLVKST